MYMQQGAPMNPGRNVGMPMGNFPQGPGVLPGPLAFLEKTTSNIGKTIKFHFDMGDRPELNFEILNALSSFHFLSNTG